MVVPEIVTLLSALPFEAAEDSASAFAESADIDDDVLAQAVIVPTPNASVIARVRFFSLGVIVLVPYQLRLLLLRRVLLRKIQRWPPITWTLRRQQ